MIRKYIIPLFALLGFILGIRTVFTGNQKPPAAEPVANPAPMVFQNVVAGSGIVEPASESIAIASHLPGVVTALYVSLGQKVKTGDPLFSIDDREQKSKILVQRAALSLAKSQLLDMREQFQLYNSVKDKRAVSAEEFTKRRNAVVTSADNVSLAESELQASIVQLERMTVRAPIDGEILQIKVRLGEFASAQAMTNPLMLMGSTNVLHVRVDIDENDAWRVNKSAQAKAYLRGNSARSTALEFVRFEPYVVPKRSLTGESSERVDTRVLQAIYRFHPEQFPVFVGQLLDVFIEEVGSGKG